MHPERGVSEKDSGRGRVHVATLPEAVRQLRGPRNPLSIKKRPPQGPSTKPPIDDRTGDSCQYTPIRRPAELVLPLACGTSTGQRRARSHPAGACRAVQTRPAEHPLGDPRYDIPHEHSMTCPRTPAHPEVSRRASAVTPSEIPWRRGWSRARRPGRAPRCRRRAPTTGSRTRCLAAATPRRSAAGTARPSPGPAAASRSA